MCWTKFWIVPLLVLGIALVCQREAAAQAGRQGASNQFVTRAEFAALERNVTDLQQAVGQLVSLQRESLLAMRTVNSHDDQCDPCRCYPVSLTGGGNIQYVADDIIDIGPDTSQALGDSRTGRVIIDTYGTARLRLPVGDGGYIAAGRGTLVPNDRMPSSPADAGSVPVSRINYKSGPPLPAGRYGKWPSSSGHRYGASGH